MRLKILPLLVLCLFCFTRSAGQRRQNIYYLKNNGTLSDPPKDADFVRIISEPDSGTNLYNVNEYYPNNQLKLTGQSYNVGTGNLMFEGSVVSFYPSGKKQRVSTYAKGRLVDNSYEYYPNGKLYAIKEYTGSYLVPDDYLYGLCLLKVCNDSLGKNLATDGNGYYITYYPDFKTIHEEGTIKDGLKEGTWKGYIKYNNDSISYVEQFAANKLISGNSTLNNDSKLADYKVRAASANFFLNDKKFADFLESNFQYPKGLKTKKNDAKVSFQFTVDRDGSLTDLKILSTPEEAIGTELLRVLEKSPKWTPEYYYGQAIPITCKLETGFTRRAFEITSTIITGANWIK